MLNEYLSLEGSTDSEKTIEWADKMVSYFRRSSHYIIDPRRYERGRNILFGKVSDIELDKLFKGAEMAAYKEKLSKSGIYIFEKLRNALIDERAGSTLKVSVNVLDPEAIELMENDKYKLYVRATVNKILKDEFTDGNGMLPVQVENDDFSGNIEAFDTGGYDERDPQDINGFFAEEYKNKEEIYLQNPISSTFKINEVETFIDTYVIDCLIGLVQCSDTYINTMDGAICIERVNPKNVKVCGSGYKNCFKSADAIMVEKTTSVRKLLQEFGDCIDLKNDLQPIMRATNTAYTGICFKENPTICIYGDSSKMCTYEAFLDLQVSYEKMYFKTISVTGKTEKKEPSRIDGQVNYENKHSQETYFAYYLNIAGNNQKILKYGKQFLQPMYGSNDEYSGFPISINYRDGIPMVDVFRPYWEIANRVFVLFEVLVNDIKPDGYGYIYETIISILEHMSRAKDAPTDVKDRLSELLKMQNESPNKIATLPKDEEGKAIGGGAFTIQKLKNGLNESAPELIKLIDWCKQKAAEDAGLEGVEFAEARDGFKLSIENKKRSRAATSFIDTLLMQHFKDIAITVLSYAKDIAQFPDIKSYKWLEGLVGPKVMQALKMSNKGRGSAHRHGVFVEANSKNDIDMEELVAIAQLELTNQRITLAQFNVIKAYDNAKQARAALARAIRNEQKRRQQEAIQMKQVEDQMDDNKHKRRLAEINLQGEWNFRRSKAESEGYVGAAENNSKARIAVEEMKIDGKAAHIAEKARADIEEVREENNLEAQKPLI